MAQTQIAQDLDLLPVLVHKVHRLDSTHHHHVDYSEAKDIVSTKMAVWEWRVPAVSGLWPPFCLCVFVEQPYTTKNLKSNRY